MKTFLPNGEQAYGALRVCSIDVTDVSGSATHIVRVLDECRDAEDVVIVISPRVLRWEQDDRTRLVPRSNVAVAIATMGWLLDGGRGLCGPWDLRSIECWSDASAPNRGRVADGEREDREVSKVEFGS